MKWECSECGAPATASRRPVACGECGTAGVIFVKMGPHDGEDGDLGGLRETWLEAGLKLAAASNEPALSLP
jgi:hypothetical protein